MTFLIIFFKSYHILAMVPDLYLELFVHQFCLQYKQTYLPAFSLLLNFLNLNLIHCKLNSVNIIHKQYCHHIINTLRWQCHLTFHWCGRQYSSPAAGCASLPGPPGWCGWLHLPHSLPGCSGPPWNTLATCQLKQTRVLCSLRSSWAQHVAPMFL